MRRVTAYEMPSATCALCQQPRSDIAVMVDSGTRVGFSAHKMCFLLLTAAIRSDVHDEGFDRLRLAWEARDARWEALRQAGDALFTAVDALAQLRELPSLVTALSGWQAARAAVKSREELT